MKYNFPFKKIKCKKNVKCIGETRVNGDECLANFISFFMKKHELESKWNTINLFLPNYYNLRAT